MKLINKIKPPCPKCPYTLEQVQFVQSPCLMCKANNYQTYKMLINRGDKNKD